MSRLIFTASSNDETGDYEIKIEKGTSSHEVVFMMNAIIKMFVRDGIFKTEKEIYDLLHKYATEAQYEELKKDDNDKVTQLEMNLEEQNDNLQ